jgi:predicted acyltransferase
MQTRILSLDVFRGFTIASMLLVNNPGDWSHLYAPLAHASWSGWTFTDCVFPFFLFIGGISMHISVTQRMIEGSQPGALLLQSQKRAAIIFLLGLMLNLIPDFNFTTLRIPGVLQRIALCTVIAGPIVILCNWRQMLGWILALLSVYSLIMLRWPVLDANGLLGSGILEPGRDAGSAIDRILLGGHLWRHSVTWDPEGLLSTLPAACNMLAGALAARFLMHPRASSDKTVWLLLSGLACLFVGNLLDHLLMPINKSLWTPSYAVFMTGWAFLTFTTFYWLLDVMPVSALRQTLRCAARPLQVYGVNALFIFVLSGLLSKMLTHVSVPDQTGKLHSLHDWIYAPLARLPVSPESASLLFALLFLLVMLGIAWGMWKKRWFVKV